VPFEASLGVEGVADTIIEVIIEAIRRLEKLAVRISQPGGVKKFQDEFNRMEDRVSKLAEQYWRARGLPEAPGGSIQPEQEPEYDPELERRGMWPPDSEKEPSDKGVPF
jgi:hypothetical protein